MLVKPLQSPCDDSAALVPERSKDHDFIRELKRMRQSGGVIILRVDGGDVSSCQIEAIDAAKVGE